MGLIDTITISFTSLKRNKLRTFLTAFAIFIGVFIIIFLVSLSFGAQTLLISQITNQFDLKSIFVLKKGAINADLFQIKAKEDTKTEVKLLNDQAISDISKIENVTFVDPVVMIFGRKLEFKDKNFEDRIVQSATGGGWDLRDGDQLVTKVLAGRYTNLAPDETVLTESLVNAYDKPAESFVGQTIILTDLGGLIGGNQGKPLKPKEYKIVGVINEIRNFAYLVSKDSGLTEVATKSGYSNPEDYVNEIGYPSLYVKASEETKVNDIAQKIKDLGYDASTLGDILSLFNTFFNIIPIIFTIVGSIAIFVAAIGIINTMIMAVFERTKEIGIMKAVGAKDKNILALFITESGLIGFIGGVLAVVISLLAMKIVERVVIDKILPDLGVTNITKLFETPPSLLVITVVASTVVGILAGLYPAIRASRLDPVKALRYE